METLRREDEEEDPVIGAQTVFHAVHKPITVHGANDPLTHRLDETVTVACGYQRAIGRISKDVCEYDTFSSSSISSAAPRVIAAHGALVDDDDILVLKVTCKVPPALQRAGPAG